MNSIQTCLQGLAVTGDQSQKMLELGLVGLGMQDSNHTSEEFDKIKAGPQHATSFVDDLP